MTQDFSARYEPCTAALYQVSFGAASMSLTMFFLLLFPLHDVTGIMHTWNKFNITKPDNTTNSGVNGPRNQKHVLCVKRCLLKILPLYYRAPLRLCNSATPNLERFTQIWTWRILARLNFRRPQPRPIAKNFYQGSSLRAIIEYNKQESLQRVIIAAKHHQGPLWRVIIEDCCGQEPLSTDIIKYHC